MNSENTLPGKIESLLATVFILALFYGDVHFGVVFPLSMAVLPVLLAVAIARRRAISGVFTLGLALLLGVLFALVLQKFAGTAPPARADWGLYGPLIYAIATAFTFSLVRVSDTTLWRSDRCSRGAISARLAPVPAAPPCGGTFRR
jgi:xanthosine utilization system XapX-like protein